MNAAIIALLFGIGASTWVFVKFQNKTGYGDNKTAVIGAGVVFVVIFFVIFSLAKMMLPS